MAVMMGVAPAVAFAWAGCSDDPPTAGGGAFVDPGGTHGAEIAITVKGRGRVTADIPGLDCPSDCFAKYVFPSASADGAAGGVTLKATPTPGLRFLGWSFDTEAVGTRGRGPESCNPIKRAATEPTISASDTEITLPFGEVDGTPPEGQEASCGAYTKVPVLYRVTASFETDAKPTSDGGPPTDGGDAGTTGEILYEPPQAGATAREIGSTQGRLYWLYSASGYSGIAYGATPSSALVPQTPVTVLDPSELETVSVFEVEQYGVVYQTGSGVFYVQAGSTTPVPMGTSAGTCTALATDTLENVYCRTGSTIVRWQYPSYTTHQTLFTNVGSGNDLLIEGGGTTAYFSTSTAVSSISLVGADGGVASPTPVATGRFSPGGLESNTTVTYLWWVESGSLYRSGKTAGSTPVATGVSGVTATTIAPDTSSTYFWAASSTAIFRAYYLGGVSTQVFRSGLSGVTGVAADSTYVYWTQSDGNVRRALKN